uniref:complement component receptor 1-like protein isoform X2 n=1 Tax=Pristiophorus japonicus TaxID=55135 RepID=UPI00398F1CE1
MKQLTKERTNRMVPMWLLGVCLAGLFIPQTYGVPYADSDASTGLAWRNYLYDDNNIIAPSWDYADNFDDLQKHVYYSGCGNPPEVFGGVAHVAGHTVTYTCNPGFAMVGTATLHCQSTGQWDCEAPVCNKIVCSTPATIANGQFSHVGGRVTYSCARGYYMLGTETLNCLITGKWDGPTPCCIRLLTNIISSGKKTQ